jgi:hypothetical protein
MTTKEASELLSQLTGEDITTRCVANLCKRGRIKASQIGDKFKYWQIEESEIKKLANDKTYLLNRQKGKKRWNI